MEHDELKNTLQHLHSHLASTATTDPELQDLLQTLDRDIQELLRKRQAGDADDTGLAARAQALSVRFATRHPQLGSVLSQLGNTLQSMGI